MFDIISYKEQKLKKTWYNKTQGFFWAFNRFNMILYLRNKHKIVLKTKMYTQNKFKFCTNLGRQRKFQDKKSNALSILYQYYRSVKSVQKSIFHNFKSNPS